jgi:hypothetical protein
VFGWQKPCYLLADEGNAASFQELLDSTPWDKYGTVNNPKCANCMAHCGYEATAVEDMLRHPLKGLLVALQGPKTEGAMIEVKAAETPIAKKYAALTDIPVRTEL